MKKLLSDNSRTGTFGLTTLLLGGLLLTSGCGDDHGHDHDEGEVITSVLLSFMPVVGGAPVNAAFRDLDGDGGAAPTIDPISLAAGTYRLSVRFQNELESPAEEITEEVRDEGDEHQVFFTGTAVDGPASAQPTAPLAHTYADMDGAGLPIGLSNMVTARTAGTGQLTVTLMHMPPAGGNAVKTSNSATAVRTNGLTAAGGSVDVNVTFPTTVR